MKGLLIKDYKLIMHNKKLVFVLMIVWLLALQNYDGYSFLIGYSTMIFILLALNTISTDDYYKSTPFLLTLPVSRGTYAAEKYVLMLGMSLLGAVFSTLVCILLHRGQMPSLIKEGLLIYILLALFQLLMLPIQLKFGGEKGRMVLIGLLSAVTVIITSISSILPKLFGLQNSIGTIAQNAVIWFFELPAITKMVDIILVCVICFAISYSVSLHIMRKKEF